jgi:hypothetical protein
VSGDISHLLSIDPATLTTVSAKEPASGFNPLDPLPSPLSLEDAKAMAESLVLPSPREPDQVTPAAQDAQPGEG